MKKAIAIATLCVLLAGCQGANFSARTKPAPAATQKPVVAQPAPVVAKPAQPMISAGTDAVMYTCMKELNALQQVNTKRYQDRSTELNSIVTEAKLYMRVRDNVSTDIHQIMDAAYQFRIAKTCSMIRTDLTRALVERVVGS
ncbi:hypothetical protein [Serratia sp. UGAL515B_01]|uniref:hypothetical protein n=1 Tax=Serratia sp. UGAL515B_01 TaxID=2986763 RepID=UPI00295464D4|nr:hypothetical protein [Serratia sp. UGAL515B_01]WON78277.1 hypothetical protein OK023_06350 [Serratia sp. UGAL515B_01]